jgi:hypothetical protein
MHRLSEALVNNERHRYIETYLRTENEFLQMALRFFLSSEDKTDELRLLQGDVIVNIPRKVSNSSGYKLCFSKEIFDSHLYHSNVETRDTVVLE